VRLGYAILALLPACGLAASAGLTTSTSSGSGPSAGAGPSAGGASQHWDHPGMLVRDQLLPLVGLTVAQARQQLAKLGYDGELVVSEQYHYDDKCGQDRVCGVEPEAGIGVHDELRLSINKKLAIAAPPP
jgi:hypothetical protein